MKDDSALRHGHNWIASLSGILLALAYACGAQADDVVPGNPNPVPFYSIHDVAHEVSAAIVATAGGVIEAQASDGTIYRLTIPPDALYANETITLTPLILASGIPGATRVMAVDMKPAGLMFFRPLTLTVVPPPDATEGTPITLALAKQDDGDALPNASAGFPLLSPYEVAVFHFSGAGIVMGNAQSIEALTSSSTAPLLDPASVGPMPQIGDPNFFSKLRENSRLQIARLESAKSLGVMSAERADGHIKGWEDVIERISEAATTKSLELAATGDLTKMDAIRAILMNDVLDTRQLQLLGDAERAWVLRERTLNALTTFAKSYLEKCHEQPGSLQAAQVLERQLELNGIANDSPESVSVISCLYRKIVAGYPDLAASATYCGLNGVGSWDLSLMGPILEGAAWSGSEVGRLIIEADGTGTWSYELRFDDGSHINIEWSGDAEWLPLDTPPHLVLTTTKNRTSGDSVVNGTQDDSGVFDLPATMSPEPC